jgi:antitoxin (DNA-binding transcriptional repressor) of toxin-antitoxin stability system
VAIPVTLNETVCGLFDAVSANVRVAVARVVEVGVAVTLTEQDAPAARLVPQVVAPRVNGEPGLSASGDREMEVAPLLVSITTWAAVVVPKGTLPKFTEPGDAVAVVATPVTLNETVCGLFEALSVNVRVPFAVDVEVGVAVTFTEHIAPAARLVPQVDPLTVNGAEVAIPPGPIEIAVVAWLVRVTLCDAVVVPSGTLPKLSTLGDAVADVDAATPVAVNVTTCGLLAALSTSLSVPGSLPGAVG